MEPVFIPHSAFRTPHSLVIELNSFVLNYPANPQNLLRAFRGTPALGAPETAGAGVLSVHQGRGRGATTHSNA